MVALLYSYVKNSIFDDMPINSYMYEKETIGLMHLG